jgi:1-deoxy-D-xylulose-5-phosphate synthase
MTIYTPVTEAGLKNSLLAALSSDGPSAIRYPNGWEDPTVVERFYGDDMPTDVGVRADFASADAEALDAVIVTHGRIVKEALDAENTLQKQGIRVGILLLEMLKPYERTAREVLSYLPKRSCRVLFLEEEIRAGGMGMLLLDALASDPKMQNKQTTILALEDTFAEQTADEPIRRSFGLDAEGIVAALSKQ